jgi:uncharacterized protein YkwD
MTLRSSSRSISIAAALSAALLLMFIPGTASASPMGAPARYTPRITAVAGDSWKMFKTTNQSRGRFDVPKLRLNRELSAIARRHSMAMARRGELFHTTSTEAVAHLQGIDWHTWGENVGYTPQDVASMQKAFMDSSPHRSNILNRGFRQVAIGTVRVDGTLWVTVFFYG